MQKYILKPPSPTYSERRSGMVLKYWSDSDKGKKNTSYHKRKSWRSYVSKINHKTPIKKVLDMIRKNSGKNKSPSYTHLNMVGTDSKATSKTDIADTLGETFCHNSSSFNYSESFRKIKTEQKKVKLNFKSQNNEMYNKDFIKMN